MTYDDIVSSMAIILGAGPAGLSTAIELLKRGFTVTIYDNKNRIGHPQHCTGIVSSRFIDSTDLPSRYVFRGYRGVYIWVGRHLYEASSSISKAFSIDRIGYELWLANQVSDLGGEIVLGAEVTPQSTYIDATGARRYIMDSVGEVLPGIQGYMKMRHSWKGDMIHILVDKGVLPDFFGWAVPLRGSVYKVGLATRRSRSKVILQELLKRVSDGESSVLKGYMHGFVIVGGHRSRFYDSRSNVVYVGDSAGQTKPSTGGGLLYMAYASRFLADRFGEGYEYIDLYEGMFGEEIRVQKLLRKMFLKMSNEDIKTVLDSLSKKELLNLALAQGDMDFHASTLLKMFMDKDILKVVAKAVGRLMLDGA